jgi:hypothetical protein
MNINRQSMQYYQAILRGLIFLVIILSSSLAPFSVWAESAKILIRDFTFTTEAAAKTYHMCGTRVDWNFEYDETRLAEIERQLTALGIPKSDWDGLLQQLYTTAELERDLYNYYKLNGITLFLRFRDFGSGLILNFSPGGYFNEEAGVDFPRSLKEFCDLAEKELNSGSEIGKYYKPRKTREFVKEFMTPWSDE